ncbi:BatA domain-containing protein [Flavobacterium sp. MAH-1]|uniref:BatA domain-containing protein n=1 Tax=Flavobacterium agri TaxID=2743471 RepID=A0A7Y8XZ19_9FLAO|nr:BatA and WFA domain-containing protein [Flavobacterium agri]NUY79327.1 BatA domain-containing protein [Flavobacterium agri]NYA69351.1 BatA domain-containing protein [Flavobacterium agri]
MQFRHPEILYFLFLLVIPIIVHLFQLRRFKKEYFTNVKFLKELSIQTRKSSRIKKWLLLATRLLLLACVIIAFAQPFFKAKDSNSAANEMYIILDNSFSMQAKGQKGELLRRAVEDLLEHTPDGRNFSLVTNTESFWNTDIKSIQKELQNLKYSATPFQLDNLIAKVNARKSAFSKDIIVITDAAGLEQKQLKGIDKESNTYFIVPESEQKNNVAVDSVSLNQTMDNFYEISVKLSAFGDENKEVPIALYNDGKLIAKTVSKMDAKQKTMNFTIPKADFNGFVQITDNGLAYDNELYFSLSKPEKTNVISIGDAAKSGFLSRIYTQQEFNFANFPLQSLDYNQIDKQDVIILNELKEIPQALLTTLKAFSEKGGNIVLIPSEESSVSNLNAFASNFGGFQFRNLVSDEKLVTKIAFSHPLYAGVFEKKIENFQYPKTAKSFAISSASAPILSYEDQSSFLTSVGNSVASVYVFAGPISVSNSNFQNSPLIVPTFYNMAQNAQKTGIISLTIGNGLPFVMDANLAKDEIVEVKGRDEKFIPVQQILNNKVKMTFNDLPQEAGNYGVFSKERLLRHIGFNYDRTESDLRSNADLLSDYKTIDSVETVFDTLQADRTNTDIWKWFVILALIFLTTELLIQKFVK